MINSPISYLYPKDISHVCERLLDNEGRLRLLPLSEYQSIERNDLRLFCYYSANYMLPTVELIDELKELIGGRSAIEIGAGNGNLGRFLGIQMTDNWCQQWPDVKSYYEMLNQPIISYGEDVEKIDALEAVEKYKPKVVVSSWTTQWIDPAKPPTAPGSIYGVREKEILQQVDCYILVGHLDIHGKKEIIAKRHQQIKSPNIVSRAANPENDRIFVWGKT